MSAMESINFEKRQMEHFSDVAPHPRTAPHRSHRPVLLPRQARRRAVRRAREAARPRRGRQDRTAPRTPQRQRLPHARPTPPAPSHLISLGRQARSPSRTSTSSCRRSSCGTTRRRTTTTTTTTTTTRRRRRRRRRSARRNDRQRRDGRTTGRVSGLFDAKQHHGHRPAASVRERLARAAWHTCRNVCRVNEPIFSHTAR